MVRAEGANDVRVLESQRATVGNAGSEQVLEGRAVPGLSPVSQSHTVLSLDDEARMSAVGV